MSSFSLYHPVAYILTFHSSILTFIHSLIFSRNHKCSHILYLIYSTLACTTRATKTTTPMTAHSIISPGFFDILSSSSKVLLFFIYSLFVKYSYLELFIYEHRGMYSHELLCTVIEDKGSGIKMPFYDVSLWR